MQGLSAPRELRNLDSILLMIARNLACYSDDDLIEVSGNCHFCFTVQEYFHDFVTRNKKVQAQCMAFC